MSQENQVRDSKEEKDDYMSELISKATKENQKLSQEELKKILQESQESVEFLKKLESIDMGNDSYRVIFTDGQEQLLFDDGEFFSINTTDSTKPKTKMTKKDARDKYIEYFIKYVLNPLIKQRELQRQTRQIARDKQRKIVHKEVKSKQAKSIEQTQKRDDLIR